MARRGHGCRCCGCSFNNIFRCEQLSVNLWNQSGELPVVTCDSTPAAGNLTAVSQWIASGSFAAGGSLTIDLDAAGLSLAASSTGNGSIQTSLFQGTAIASSAISGSVRSISMNSDQRLAVLDQTHAISVRSCKTQSGRFVTAYAGATPRSTDVPGITPRASVKFWQQGEPGFTNQFIDGLQNVSFNTQNNPYWMTQACRVAVYRDGEYVDTVTRDPSLCVLEPGGESSVSEQSGSSYPNVQQELDAIFQELGTIQPPADPYASQRTELFNALQQAGAAVSAIPNDPTYWPGLISETSVVIGQLPNGNPIQRARTLIETLQEFSFDQLAAGRQIGKKKDGTPIFMTGAILAQLIVYDVALSGRTWPGDFSGCDFTNGYPISCVYGVLGGTGGVHGAFIALLQQEKNERDAARAAAIAARDAVKAQYDALPPLPTYGQQQFDRIRFLTSEYARLQKSLGIAKVRDWIVQHSGIVRLSGYKARAGFPSNGDAIGGKNIAYQHQDHAYWGSGAELSTDDSWQDRRAENAVYFYAKSGQRIRLVILYGGSGTLTIEPSGAILGTFGEETSPEGSYLVVSKYDDDCMPSGWQGQRNYDNVDDGWQGLGGYRSYQATLGLTVTEPRRLSQRRYEFNSFVVDKTPPSIVARQVNDFVVGDWPTEVNVSSVDYFTGIYRIEASPLFVADEPVVGGFTHRAEYVTRPPVMGDQGFYRATNPLLKDRAHNVPLLTPAVEFTIHDEMSGAKSTFVAQGENETLRTSPLTTLDLAFDKPVVGVLKRHFTIESYGRRDDNTFGQIATGSVIESVTQHDETTFQLLLKAEKQMAGTQWRITFQPDGDVVADMGESTEPCILAARFAWIRPQANVRQLIDTASGSQFTIGNTASVSASVAEPAPGQPPATALASSSTVSLPASGGSFHSNHDADSFSPNAPPHPDTATSVPYSYFGMGTTIYPSPARLLSACAAPSEPQKHFSAMMAANNYTTITAHMATHVPLNGKTYAGRLVVPDTTGRPHAQFSPNWESVVASIEELVGSNLPAGYNLAAYFLQRWFFGPLSFTASSGLGIASQNQWAAAGSSEQYVTVIRGETRQRLGIFDIVPVDDIGELYFTRGSASMAATRVVQEYAGLSTAVPGDLVLAMRVPVTTRVAIERLMRVLDYVETPPTGSPINHYKWEMQSFPNYAGASQTYDALFHLSKSQEHALASGSAVQVVVPNTSSRATPVTDPNSPIPGGIEDINRHVWTLQAS